MPTLEEMLASVDDSLEGKLAAASGISERAKRNAARMNVQSAQDSSNSLHNPDNPLGRYLKGMVPGIPTSKQEFLKLLGDTAIGSMLPPGTQQAMNSAQTFYNNPSFVGFNQATNPMAPAMEAYGSGDVAGGLGGTTANILMALLGGKLAGPKSTPKGKIASAGHPVVEPTIPITVETPEPSMGTRMGRAAWELLPIPKVLKAVHAFRGREATPPRTSNIPYQVMPDKPTPPLPQFSGSDFPLNWAVPEAPIPQRSGSAPLNSPGIVNELLNPVRAEVPFSAQPPMTQFGAPQVGPLPPPEIPMGSPPLRTGADWFQTPKEAAFGDAYGRKRLDPFLTNPRDIHKRLGPVENFDQSSTVTQGMTPPFNLAELQGINSQQQQMLQGAEIQGPNAVGGFSPPMLRQLLELLSQLPDD